MKIFQTIKFYAFGVLLFAILAGCAQSGKIKKMEEVHSENTAIESQEGKALVVFVRPRDLVWKRYPGIFDVTNDEPVLVGVLAANSKVAYRVESGEHLFMSAGHATATEFMRADLLPQKTYYVLVSNGVRGFADTFFLKPLRPDEWSQSKIDKIRWIKKNRESDEWAQEHMNNLMLRSDAYGQEMEVPHLQKEDFWSDN